MNKSFPSAISIITAFVAVTYVGYFLLLTDNWLHISITSIIHTSRHFAMNAHLLILGLLPIYIAAMIFGAAFLGIYLGSRLEYMFFKTARSK